LGAGVFIRKTKSFDVETAGAEWGGEAVDLDHTLFVLAQYFQPAAARAGPD
jgi:hypothetical protein